MSTNDAATGPRPKGVGAVSPGHALGAMGFWHAISGAVVYRDVLRELVRSGLVGSVGDGIFVTSESRGPRAAAFWFMFPAPLMVLLGYHVHAASRSGDARALTATGWTVGALGVAGAMIIPRSGFWSALPIAGWLLRSGRRLAVASAPRDRCNRSSPQISPLVSRTVRPQRGGPKWPASS